MPDNDEYLRLPHGMHDREEEWIKRERKILKNCITNKRLVLKFF